MMGWDQAKVEKEVAERKTQRKIVGASEASLCNEKNKKKTKRDGNGMEVGELQLHTSANHQTANHEQTKAEI